ncbi:hypothetical protein [Mucilaginibacter sp.]
MKKLTLPVLAMALMLLSSCSAIEGIFKAGFVTAIIAVVVVIGLIIWIVSMFNRK